MGNCLDFISDRDFVEECVQNGKLLSSEELPKMMEKDPVMTNRLVEEYFEAESLED